MAEQEQCQCQSAAHGHRPVKTVDIDTDPGSSPDRVVLTVKVLEQPTGELSFGVGYSTSPVT